MSERVDIAEVKRGLLEHLEDLLHQLIGGGPDQTRRVWKAARKAQGGIGDSLEVELRGDRRGIWIHRVSGQGGDLIDLIKYVNGGTTGDTIKWASEFLGGEFRAVEPRARPKAGPKRQPTEGEAERQGRALNIWRSSQPIEGTPAEIYLRGRGLACERMPLYEPGRWPATLAWNDDAIRKPGVKPRAALVVAVGDASRGGIVCAVQRVFLNADGTPVVDKDGKKLKLSLGPIDGNAARLLCPPDLAGRWGLAEGVESALAARQLFGFAVWSAISAGNMPKIKPPWYARRVTIFADHDDAGIAAATKAADRLRLVPKIEAVRILRMKAVGADAADALKGAA